MRTSLALMAALVVAMVACLNVARAEESKAVTLKGTMTCGKCTLKDTAKCQDVLVVKEGDKEVRYYLVDNDVAKAAHKNVCTTSKADVSVTGTVVEKEGKMMMTASKVEFPEAKK